MTPLDITVLAQRAPHIKRYNDAHDLIEGCAAIARSICHEAKERGTLEQLRPRVAELTRLENKVYHYLEEGSIEMARSYIIKLVGLLEDTAVLAARLVSPPQPVLVKPSTQPVIDLQRLEKPKQKHGLPLAERFWRYVAKTESCWLWTGRDRDGIAMFSINQRTSRAAHTLALELTINRPVRRATRTCGNKRCVNPDHMTGVIIEMPLDRSTTEAVYA